MFCVVIENKKREFEFRHFLITIFFFFSEFYRLKKDQSWPARRIAALLSMKILRNLRELIAQHDTRGSALFPARVCKNQLIVQLGA